MNTSIAAESRILPPLTLAPRTWVLAAHPDDETLGAGATLAASTDVGVLHLTTGAPIDQALWPEDSPATRHDYAWVRRLEAEGALALAGISPDRVRCLGGEDQGAIMEAASLATTLMNVIEALDCRWLVTHAYEGGHPDHDAAALAAHLAVRSLERAGRPAPALYEMTSYHAFDGTLRTGEFLGEAGPVHVRVLTPEEVSLKRSMLANYTSQRQTLAQFPVHAERFRVAPRYQFNAPPHPGRLWYEQMGWMEGARWREFAEQALLELGFGRDACL